MVGSRMLEQMYLVSMLIGNAMPYRIHHSASRYGLAMQRAGNSEGKRCDDLPLILDKVRIAIRFHEKEMVRRYCSRHLSSRRRRMGWVCW